MDVIDTKAPEAGAPEIEVTPAMIEAGVAEFCQAETYFSTEEYWAERIYRAMRAAAPRPSTL
jgi:hypothetical protein